MISLAIVLGVLLSVGLLYLLFTFIKRRLREAEGALRRRLEPEGVVRTSRRSNFFGIASRGMAQTRGNGVLVLTRKALHFEMLLPKETITVPVEHILEVKTPRSFLGKSVGRKLLQVKFRAEGGRIDEAAWWVDDLDNWVADLRELARLVEG